MICVACHSENVPDRCSIGSSPFNSRTVVFRGGVIGQRPIVPVTFNTGQILLGLARGIEAFGDQYRPAFRAAADWLVATQDTDGAWRQHATPFAVAGEKAYETHVAWGLLEAARVEPNPSYIEAAKKNVRWALTKQQENGWFGDACLNMPERPLTHTIGYVLRGVIETYLATGEPGFLEAALRTANGVLRALQPDGAIPGRLDAHWKSAANWVCLTGNVQIAHCWLQLYQATGDTRFRDAGFMANLYVRTTVSMDGPGEIRGGVKGSFPTFGSYCRFEYPSWACKFFIDAHRLERAIRQSS